MKNKEHEKQEIENGETLMIQIKVSKLFHSQFQQEKKKLNVKI